MARADFAFFHPLRVRWAEVDMQAIVFNGHYLTYFDVAFTEYWRATGLPGVMQQAEDGQEMFARKATIEYHAPARFDDVLDIGVPTGVFASELTVPYFLFRDAGMLCIAARNASSVCAISAAVCAVDR